MDETVQVTDSSGDRFKEIVLSNAFPVLSLSLQLIAVLPTPSGVDWLIRKLPAPTRIGPACPDPPAVTMVKFKFGSDDENPKDPSVSDC